MEEILMIIQLKVMLENIELIKVMIGKVKIILQDLCLILIILINIIN